MRSYATSVDLCALTILPYPAMKLILQRGICWAVKELPWLIETCHGVCSARDAWQMIPVPLACSSTSCSPVALRELQVWNHLLMAVYAFPAIFRLNYANWLHVRLFANIRSILTKWMCCMMN